MMHTLSDILHQTDMHAQTMHNVDMALLRGGGGGGGEIDHSHTSALTIVTMHGVSLPINVPNTPLKNVNSTPDQERVQKQSKNAELLERFSKPNFGSIRRFRTMTGLEIEN